MMLECEGLKINVFSFRFFILFLFSLFFFAKARDKTRKYLFLFTCYFINFHNTFDVNDHISL